MAKKLLKQVNRTEYKSGNFKHIIYTYNTVEEYEKDKKSIAKEQGWTLIYKRITTFGTGRIFEQVFCKDEIVDAIIKRLTK